MRRNIIQNRPDRKPSRKYLKERINCNGQLTTDFLQFEGENRFSPFAGSASCLQVEVYTYEDIDKHEKCCKQPL